jgi:hypothetical protein
MQNNAAAAAASTPTPHVHSHYHIATAHAHMHVAIFYIYIAKTSILKIGNMHIARNNTALPLRIARCAIVVVVAVVHSPFFIIALALANC